MTAALATNLPSEISSFIPGCAEECLLSFLAVNYASTGCAGKLTLDCMCSRLGATGFTLGEGAMQCISAERSVGYCSEYDASDEVINNAYDMCTGRPHAIDPSHRTITATLVLAPSGGVITFPSATRTMSHDTTSSTTKTLPTTLVLDTSSAPPLPRPSSRTTRRSTRRSETNEHSATESADLSTSEPFFITEPPSTISTLETSTISTTTTSSSTTETEASTSTEAPVGGAGGEDDDKKDSGKLSSEQVAGISVGVLAAAGVAAGAIVLARHYRRKNYPKVKTGFLPMRDTWGYKPDQSGNGGHTSWMIHQLRPDLDPAAPPPPPPPAYNRRSLKPDTIGLAISPPPSRSGTAHSSPLRRMSKLLPAKPILPSMPLRLTKEKSPPLLQPEWDDTEQHNAGPSSQENEPQLPPLPLASPTNVASPTRIRPMPPAPPKLQIPAANNPIGAAPVTSNRESNVTEFEEDRTSISPNANTQVWRPPPTTPISAGTFYVADQCGNWVLGNSKRASWIVRGSQGSQGSQEVPPKPPPKDDLSFGAATAATAAAGQTQTRTLAPPAEITPAATQPKEKPAGPRPQYPSPFFSSQSHPRRNGSMRRSMTRNLTRPRENSSSSSATIITTSSEDSSSGPPPPPDQQVSLSPVVESPHSGRGRTGQPKIPPRDPRRMSQMTAQGDSVNPKPVPPPSRQLVYNPPGQPSPTLGMMQPPTTYNDVPQRGVNNPQPVQNTGLDKTDSPTMRIVDPSPEPDESQEAQAVEPNQIRSSPFYFDPPYPQPLNTRHPSQHRRSASGPQPQTYRPYQRPPSHQPSPQQQQANWQPVQPRPPSYQSFRRQQPPQPYQQPYQQQQQQPMGYQPFQPHQANLPYPRNSAYQSFQPQQHSQIHPSRVPYQPYHPSPAMNPPAVYPGAGDPSLLAKRLGSNRAADMSIGTDKPGTSKWRRDPQDRSLPGPASSHWKPTLTPTRRGDDLFLNVQ
ncbi:hypothetical protein FDECE_3003 [Fusarium decemcellulare]|nr:hypothetical protein FDECE_3003 [Fusarium decemcellulare]